MKEIWIYCDNIDDKSGILGAIQVLCNAVRGGGDEIMKASSGKVFSKEAI